MIRTAIENFQMDVSSECKSGDCRASLRPPDAEGGYDAARVTRGTNLGVITLGLTTNPLMLTEEAVGRLIYALEQARDISTR